jgi:riboflavin kinase/FMN adenylyltransferase
MKVCVGNEAQLAQKCGVVTIGTFDGVHRGHQAVLTMLTKWAHQELPQPSPAGVLTFRTHPRRTLAGQSPDLVTTLEHRLVLFERAHVDFAWVLEFTPEMAALPARDFARTYLVEHLGIQGLVLGFNSSFGSDSVGSDSPALAALARDLGFGTRSCPPARSPEGEIISSTRIRDAIYEGRLRDAEMLLGRHVSVYGTVVRGDARGRRLGYRTANIDLGEEVRPPFGVYATVAIVDGARVGSVTNVGYRPTVATNLPADVKPDLLLETHLFDYQGGELYGKKIEVLFIEKLRDERRFHDVAALVEQIRKDEARARAILEAQAS